MSMARYLTFAPIRGIALLTNSNQTAEKRSKEEWPLFAELCTSLTLYEVDANGFYIHIDEMENATLKLGVFSPHDRFVYSLDITSDKINSFYSFSHFQIA